LSMVIARRYARALADVLGPAGDFHGTLNQLQDVLAAYRESPELREVFDTPAVSVPDKLKVLTAIAASLGASPVTVNFLRVLVLHFRMALLPEVVEAFRDLAYERLGIVQVEVVSATALSEPSRRSLQAGFNRLLKKQVELEFQVDLEILGGVRAQIGSTVYDGSVRGALARLGEQLILR
jgi:F-type H+-transporting ATPase subunit delta